MRRSPLPRHSPARDAPPRSSRRPCGPLAKRLGWRGRGGVWRRCVRLCLRGERYVGWDCKDLWPSVCASPFQYPYAEGYAPTQEGGGEREESDMHWRHQRLGGGESDGASTGTDAATVDKDMVRRCRCRVRSARLRRRRFRAGLRMGSPSPLSAVFLVSLLLSALSPPSTLSSATSPSSQADSDSLSSSSHLPSHASLQDIKSRRTRRATRLRYSYIPHGALKAGLPVGERGRDVQLLEESSFYEWR
jgi:hypothetical protein